MTKTILPSPNSFFGMPKTREPTLAVPAGFSGVASGLSFSIFVVSNGRLLLLFPVNVSARRIITYI